MSLSSSDKIEKTHYHIKQVDKDGNVISAHDVTTSTLPPCAKESSRLQFNPRRFASINSLFQVGKNYCAIGRYQEALSVLKDVVDKKQDHADAHFQLGLVYHKLGDKSSAMNEWLTLKNLNQDMANELYSKSFTETESSDAKSKTDNSKDAPKHSAQNNKQEDNFKKPSIFESPTFKRLVRNKTAWIITGVVLLIIWGAITDNNKRTSSSSGSSYQPSTNKESNYGNGQYRCSSYHIGKANALEPDSTVKTQLDTEETNLNKLADELKSLKRTIESTRVNEYSQESINRYNRLVDSHNKKMKTLKTRATDFDNKNAAFNKQIDAYNKYLDDNCTKAR